MKSVVLAYRSDWNAKELPAERIDYKPLTHIANAFALADKGGIRFPAVDSSRALIETAHRNDVKVLLAVGGAESNKELSAICATPVGTRQLAEQIASHVQTMGYDGVDIDWEMPESVPDTNRLSGFTAALRKVLPRTKMLTMAVTPVDWFGRWFDGPALIPYLDWIAVMCYDLYGPWSERAGHQAALLPPKGTASGTEAAMLTASGAIRYWREKKKIPANKLLLGIPLYARGFRAKQWGDPVPDVSDKKFETSYRALNSIGKSEDALVCATWLGAAGTVRYSGDNPESARKKGIWAKQNGLAGVFFWELSQDGDGKTLPSIVRAAREGFEK